jgi:hypothetical protein
VQNLGDRVLNNHPSITLKLGSEGSLSIGTGSILGTSSFDFNAEDVVGAKLEDESMSDISFEDSAPK